MPIICNDNNNACFTRSNYPRPIFNCSADTCSGRNTIVNPTRSEEWGFLTGGEQEVTQDDSLAIGLISSAGTAVTQTVADAANITTGNYQISYSVNASSSTNPLQFGVLLDDGVLEYSILSANGDGNMQNLSTSFVLSVAKNSQLSIVNLTAGSANISRVNLSVTKLLS